MPQFEEVFRQLEKFLSQTAPSQDLTAEQKLEEGRRLLAKVRRAYRGMSLARKQDLDPKVATLRKTLRRLSEAEVRRVPYGSGREKKLEEARRYLQFYKGRLQRPKEALSKVIRIREELQALARPPTKEEQQVLRDLENLEIQLRGRAREISYPSPRPEAPIGGTKKLLPEIKRAEQFIQQVELAPPTTEQNLRKRSYQAVQLVGELRRKLASLAGEQYRQWDTPVRKMIDKVQSLRRGWQRQLERLKKKEAEERRWAWVREKRRRERQRKIASRREAVEAERMQTVASRAVDSFEDEVSRLVSSAKIVMQRAQEQKLPEALPVERLSGAVQRAQALVKGMRKRVSGPKAKALERKLALLESTFRKMQNLKRMLAA